MLVEVPESVVKLQRISRLNDAANLTSDSAEKSRFKISGLCNLFYCRNVDGVAWQRCDWNEPSRFRLKQSRGVAESSGQSDRLSNEPLHQTPVFEGAGEVFQAETVRVFHAETPLPQLGTAVVAFVVLFDFRCGLSRIKS